jgi:RecB family exonuclease
VDHPWFVFGNFNHLILEKFFKYIIYFKNRNREYDKKNLMHRAFNNALKKQSRLSQIGKATKLNQTQIDDTKTIIKNFFNKVSDNEPDVAYVEKEISLDFGDGVTLIGYIDRVDKVGDRAYRIVDYKTSKAAYKIDKNIQLDIYAIGLKKALKDDNLKIYKQLDFIKTGKATSPNAEHDNSTDESIMSEIKTQSLEMKSKKELYSGDRTQWEPIKNKYCFNCDFLQTCNRDKRMDGGMDNMFEE